MAFDTLGDLFKTQPMIDDTLKKALLQTACILVIPALLTYVDNKLHIVSDAHGALASIHIYLALVAILIYARATLLIVGYFNKSQSLSKGFTLSGWLAAFSHYRNGPSSAYISRLAVMICFLMVSLNTYHLFTFSHEAVADIKNVVWRFGHVLIAMLLAFIGEEYRNYILKSSLKAAP